jgi:hypothetical protein
LTFGNPRSHPSSPEKQRPAPARRYKSFVELRSAHAVLAGS